MHIRRALLPLAFLIHHYAMEIHPTPQSHNETLIHSHLIYLAILPLMEIHLMLVFIFGYCEQSCAKHPYVFTCNPYLLG